MSISIADIAKSVDIDGDGQMDPEEQEIIDLLKRMDVDGDGTIGLRELVNLGNSMNESKKETGRMRMMLYAGLAASVIIMGIMFCVCMAAVEAAKDSRPTESGKLETVDGKTVATNVNRGEVTVFNLNEQDMSALRQLDSISFAVGNAIYAHSINTVQQDITADQVVVTIHLANGEKIRNTADETVLISNDGSPDVDLEAVQQERKHRHRHLLQVDESQGMMATMSGDAGLYDEAAMLGMMGAAFTAEDCKDSAVAGGYATADMSPLYIRGCENIAWMEGYLPDGSGWDSTPPMMDDTPPAGW